jgi:cystathionine beta-lyase
MNGNEFDVIRIEDLRAGGGVKWSMFPEAIGTFVAEMDFGIAPAIEQALHAAVSSAQFGYLPPKLATTMNEATAGWLRESAGWEVPPTSISPIADVIKALEVTIEHYSAPGSPVIVPTPAYMPFLTVPPMYDREVIQVPLALVDGRYEFDLDAIDAALAPRGGLFILCNPYNPVGRVFTRGELEALSEVIERRGARVFSDEIHAPLIYSGHQHVSYASISDVAAGHTVTATSASKAWNIPGLKCAQIILSNDADLAVWERIGMMASHGASNLGVIANTAAYTSGLQWLDDVVSYLDGNRKLLGELLAEHLPDVGYTAPEGTYIAWLDWRAYDLGDSAAEFMRERAGVAMTDGLMCGDVGRGFTRLIFATPRPVLEQAVRQMAEAVQELRAA